jgi:hypothetical protein
MRFIDNKLPREDFNSESEPPVIFFPPAIIVAPFPPETMELGLTNLYGLIVLENIIDSADLLLVLAAAYIFPVLLVDNPLVCSHNIPFPKESYFLNQNTTICDGAIMQNSYPNDFGDLSAIGLFEKTS